MSEEIKNALRQKAREAKDGEGGVQLPEGLTIGELPLDAANARVLPDPTDEQIEVEKQTTLHSVICRAGYQRNIHRTEGIAYRSLYEDLLAFFLTELEGAGKVVVDKPTDETGVEESDDEREGEGASPDPEESAGAGEGSGLDAGTAGDVRDQGGGSPGPKQRQRKKRSKRVRRASRST
jgi:hypothetical protein